MTRTQAILDQLRVFESRNVTYLDPAGDWPIVWARARGCHVWDADGRRYLDLTAAFGVAATGHANPRVVRAGQRQMATLLHAMGDVHPHPLKAALARELSRITFERWGAPGCAGSRGGTATTKAKTIFGNSGFEAVEAALKTAVLATGRPGVIAFEGAYHGLGYGALTATHRDHFRSPFRRQLREFARFLPFPGISDVARVADQAERLLKRGGIGAILIEPIQARAGIRISMPGFLPRLRRLCDDHGALLILDEIYTGFGRTGRWFACEGFGVVPHLICLGKALTGGFPVSACVGRADLMDAAWPASTGEAIHTSTFIGHPVGCAMALAQIGEIRRLKLVERADRLGGMLRFGLMTKTTRVLETMLPMPVGLGLMLGVNLRHTDGSPATAESLRITKAMLKRGFIVLPEGADANVISFTPPLTISERDLRRALKAFEEVLVEVCAP